MRNSHPDFGAGQIGTGQIGNSQTHAGEVLSGEIGVGQDVAAQIDAAQIVRLVAGRGGELGRRQTAVWKVAASLESGVSDFGAGQVARP